MRQKVTASRITAKADSEVSTVRNGYVIQDSPLTGITLNRLAREQMKKRLLADILTDLMVCEIEGISKMEYINELIDMLAGLKARDL